jgi:hypothetical protein
MNVIRLSAYTALPVLALLSLPCVADNCNGRWTNVTVSSETLEVAKGHTVTFCGARELDQ